MSVVVETPHPRPTSSTRMESGTRTSVKKTSLNSASPVICRRGLVSTWSENLRW